MEIQKAKRKVRRKDSRSPATQADQLRAALKPNTKALILCNPSNPTGSVITEAGQRELLDVLEQHEQLTGTRVWVISDEIYERLHYEPSTPHASFAALDEGAKQRTVTVNGFSKAFAMTGFRLGYLAAPLAVASVEIKSSSALQFEVFRTGLAM